jgi:hypothetical protein
MADPTNPQTAARLAEGKQLGGRPTTYLPEYCEKIIKYFSRPATETRKKTITTAKGTVIEQEIEVASSLPTLEGFAATIGTTAKTMREWAEQEDEFCSAYTRAQELQKAILIENGTKGLYNPQFTIFVAKNCTDMRDKVEVDHTVRRLEDVIREIDDNGQSGRIRQVGASRPVDNPQTIDVDGEPSCKLLDSKAD